MRDRRWHNHHDEILQGAVAAGRRPRPDTVMLVLESLLHLIRLSSPSSQSNHAEEDENDEASRRRHHPTGLEYTIDMATLEVIGAAATKVFNAESGLNERVHMVIWDLLDAAAAVSTNKRQEVLGED